MTIEEKAKAYDEALDRCKDWASGAWGHSVNDSPKDIAEFIFPQLAESEDESMMREFNDWLCEGIECRTNDLRDEKDRRTLNMLCYVLTKLKDYLEKQKINTEGDFGRGYDCGYEACLKSHGAEWFEKQKEPHFTKRNALFDKCVENCDPEVMKEVSDKVDAMLEKEQKPAEWSEEDEVYLQDALWCVKQATKVAKSENDMGACWSAERWLKSLRLQPKQEWSEEDEDMLNSCISSIEEAKENRYAYKETDGDTSYDHEIAWLKSLRPQYHGDVTMTEAYKMGLEAGKLSSWKPSEHQMTILKAVKEYVGRGSGYWGEALGSLIEDLEKL